MIDGVSRSGGNRKDQVIKVLALRQVEEVQSSLVGQAIHNGEGQGEIIRAVYRVEVIIDDHDMGQGVNGLGVSGGESQNIVVGVVVQLVGKSPGGQVSCSNGGHLPEGGGDGEFLETSILDIIQRTIVAQPASDIFLFVEIYSGKTFTGSTLSTLFPLGVRVTFVGKLDDVGLACFLQF